MKVFISWSGSENKAIAGAVKDLVLTSLGTGTTFVSDVDIEAGTRALEVIDDELTGATAAFVLVSKASMRRPWLNYELGALSVRVKRIRVVPLMLDLDAAELISPVNQFQAIRFDDSTRMRETLERINDDRADRGINTATLRTAYKSLYPSFVERVQKEVDEYEPEDQGTGATSEEKVDQILAYIRAQATPAEPPRIGRKSWVSTVALNELELMFTSHGIRRPKMVQRGNVVLITLAYEHMTTSLAADLNRIADRFDVELHFDEDGTNYSSID